VERPPRLVGTPLDLYNHPANLFVAGFIGSPRMNFLAVEAGSDGGGDAARRLIADGATAAFKAALVMSNSGCGVAPGVDFSRGLLTPRAIW
jgi:multiple sugar transport system ATP-binding protein